MGSIRLCVLAATVVSLAGSVSAQNRAPIGGVPVTLTAVARQDMPVLLYGLGSVQPFQSVNVRARVDGTLDRVLFTEGGDVKPGELIAQLDPRPYQAALDQVLAKRAADEATMQSVKADLTRYVDLAASQIASRQKLEQSRALVGQAEAIIRGDEASIAAARLNLGFTQITAPIGGRIGLRQIDVGNLVRVADPATTVIATITQIHPIALSFTVPQDALPSVQRAMRRGQLPVSAFSAEGKVPLAEGRLAAIESAIDPATGTIKLKAVFANADEALWPGQFVRVALRTELRAGVAVLASGAVQRGPDGFYVYLVKPDQTVTRRPITVAQDDGTLALVETGLEPGDSVVLSGQSRLTEGTAITQARPAG